VVERKGDLNKAFVVQYLYVYALYIYQNKQRLVPLTA
jgi:hypothetical protein